MAKRTDIARVQGTEEERRALWSAAGREGMRVGPWLLKLGLRAAQSQQPITGIEVGLGTTPSAQQ